MNNIDSFIEPPEVVSFHQLLSDVNRRPLAIDTYQRGFVWNPKQITQLLDDLYTFQTDPATQENANRQYYLGSLLLHYPVNPADGKPRSYVIDGQQRLTALAILYHQLHGQLPSGIDFQYRSTESEINIRNGLRLCRDTSNRLGTDIFKQVCFTIIRVKTEDLAFTFFDTQNGRGVPLQATDLLKAYHLRAIVGDRKHELQAASARRWEHLQESRAILGLNGDFAPALIGKFLWRGRRWTGSRLRFESRDAVLAEFGECTSKPLPQAEQVSSHPNLPCFMKSVLFVNPSGEGYRFFTETTGLDSHPAHLPFSLRQPINRGVGFFLYVDKYSALLHDMYRDNHPDKEVRAFKRFYDQVLKGSGLSAHLREAFMLAMLVYADRFGFQQLLRTALWMDYSLGAKRIELDSIRMETARKYFGDSSRNLLDVIAAAYEPAEVVAFLKNNRKAEEEYLKTSVKTGSDVKGRYYAALLSYFGKSADSKLARREQWITEDLVQLKLREVQGS